MSEERVQRLMAQAGIASRRKAEDLIREGRVTVNGRTVEIGAKADPAKDEVRVDGKPLRPPVSRRYLLLYKPPGCISTRSDPEGRTTVFDLLPKGMVRGLVTVGRLDYNTEGLLILTDDGDFAHRVAHPSFGCRKIYEVKVKGAPSESAIAKLRKGIVLDGQRTARCRIRELSTKGERKARRNTWWTIDLAEGRSRQIREMFFRIGHPVQRLRRVAIGSVRDPRLRPGGFRDLSRQEIDSLMGRGSGRRSAR